MLNDWNDLHWGKYDSPLCHYVAEGCDGSIVGDAEETESSDVDVDFYALFGKRIYHVDSQGFHYLWKYDSAEEARREFVAMTDHLRPVDEDAPFPADWNEWRKVWGKWKDENAEHLLPTSYRFPPKNVLADEILGKWGINGRAVELSEVTFPALGERPERTIRYIGITYGNWQGDLGKRETALVGTFGELARELGIA